MSLPKARQGGKVGGEEGSGKPSISHPWRGIVKGLVKKLIGNQHFCLVTTSLGPQPNIWWWHWGSCWWTRSWEEKLDMTGVVADRLGSVGVSVWLSHTQLQQLSESSVCCFTSTSQISCEFSLGPTLTLTSTRKWFWGSSSSYSKHRWRRSISLVLRNAN